MKKNRVLVIGDIILDQYNNGSVKRISPEAPVPIVNMDDTYYRLGGAANVANNIAALGSPVSILGVIGNDDKGNEIYQICKNKKIGINGLIKESKYKTITKVRILGNNQQIIRLDYNDKQEMPKKCHETLFESFKKLIINYDVVILSDYAKGICEENFCQRVIEFCQKEKKRVLVDPKGTNWKKYNGASLISPNMKEISEYLQKTIKNIDSEIDEICSDLNEKLQVEYLMITRSEKGISLIDINKKSYHFPSKAKEVYDVSGAGDTVIAMLGVYWNNRNNIFEAIHLANTAAGIVVGKKGTATVSEEELMNTFSGKETFPEKKIVPKDTLKKIVLNWKSKGETIAFTNGCYDIFHRGHAYSIYTAAQYAQHLIVAINSDQSVKRLKGKDRPINSDMDRAYVIASIGCVDKVIVFEEDTPAELLSIIQPDVLVKGGDYKIEEIAGREYAGRVELVGYIEGYSTTDLLYKVERNGE